MKIKTLYISNKNLIFSLINVALSVIQSLWLISYIQSIMGIEAYGYISVIIGIVNMTTVLSTALTSVSSRYITLELEKGDLSKANEYFNSIFFSLTAICGLLFIIGVVFIPNITFWLRIDVSYIKQVKVLTAFVGGSLILNILDAPFIAGLYFKDEIYKMHVFTSSVYLCRIVFALLLFNFCTPKIWYPYLGDFVAQILIFLYYITNYKKVLPGIKIKSKFLSRKIVSEVINSGIWVSISKMGAILLSNVSVYLANLLFLPFLTGVYSSILQLVSLLTVLTNSLVTIFISRILQCYANHETEKLVDYVKSKITFLGCLLGFASGGIWVFGKYFFSLWLDETFMQYETLIRLSVVYLPLTYVCEVLNQVLIAFNKTKPTAILMIISGTANVVLSLIFAKVFNIGIYALPLALMISTVGLYITYFPLYSARLLEVGRMTFYFSQFKGIAAMAFTIIISSVVTSMIVPEGWPLFLLDVFLVTAIMGTCIFIFMLFRKRNKKYL